MFTHWRHQLELALTLMAALSEALERLFEFLIAYTHHYRLDSVMSGWYLAATLSGNHTYFPIYLHN